MKAATIYERNGKVYVHSSSRTTAGLWVINDPILVVDKEDTSEVGRALRACLAASQKTYRTPSRSQTCLIRCLILQVSSRSERS